MNPLPQIIQLGQDAKLDEVKENQVEVPQFNAVVAVVKKFIFFITKDLSKEDLELFKAYNMVEYEDHLHKNLPIHSFEWDILVFDLREKADRYAVMKEVLPFRNLYNLIVYAHSFELDDLEIEYDNAFAKFPERQASKQEFEKVLLQKRLKKPRWYVSLFSCLASVYAKTRA